MYILDGVHDTCEGMKNDLVATLFPNQSDKPLLLLDFLRASQPRNPVAWMASGVQWKFPIDQLFPKLPAGPSVPLWTSKQLSTRGDASLTSPVGISLC